MGIQRRHFGEKGQRCEDLPPFFSFSPKWSSYLSQRLHRRGQHWITRQCALLQRKPIQLQGKRASLQKELPPFRQNLFRKRLRHFLQHRIPCWRSHSLCKPSGRGTGEEHERDGRLLQLRCQCRHRGAHPRLQGCHPCLPQGKDCWEEVKQGKGGGVCCIPESF